MKAHGSSRVCDRQYGSMAGCSHGAEAITKSLYMSQLGTACASDTPKPTSADISPSTKPHLLTLPKQFHQPGDKLLNILTYESHFNSNHYSNHFLIGFQSCSMGDKHIPGTVNLAQSPWLGNSQAPGRLSYSYFAKWIYNQTALKIHIYRALDWLCSQTLSEKFLCAVNGG